MMLEWDRSNETSKIILDNKQGITDWDTLNEVERRLSKFRLAELEIKEADKKLVFDEKYFLSIHKNLFQDIYPWAGTVREVDLYKENSAFAPSRFLDNSLEDFFSNLKKDNYLKGFELEEVAELSSYYMLELNFIHPFREGNGRTKRYFMTQLLKGAGFDLGLERIDAKQLVMADVLAFDDNEADIKANPSYFKSLLHLAIKPLQEPKKAQKTPLEKLNNFLWIFDRYDSRGWFANKKSIEDSLSKLENLLESDEGIEKVVSCLNRIIINEKKYYDGTAEYRKDIIAQANQFKNDLGQNLAIFKKEAIMENQNKHYTEYIVNQAVIEALSKDLDYVDAKFTDLNIDKLVKQNIELKKNFNSNAKFDPEVALEMIDKKKWIIPSNILENYGWGDNGNIERNILNHLKQSNKDSVVAEKEKGMSLAEKIDQFYSIVDTYGRYDREGAFSPENDIENNSLKEIQSTLSTNEGRKELMKFFDNVIKEDQRPEVVKKAKTLKFELLDPRNDKGSIKYYAQNHNSEEKIINTEQVKKTQKSMK